MAIDDNTDDKALEDLLQSGKFSDTTDITELAAALNGTDGKVIDDKTESTTANAENTEKVAATAAEAAAVDSTAAPAVAASEDPAPTTTDPESFASHPIYGALKGTRRMLAQERAKSSRAEEQRADLERQLQEAKAVGATQQETTQDAADKAGITDKSGNAVDVLTVDISKLRGNFDDEIVDAIEALQNISVSQRNVIKDLQGREAQRVNADKVSVANSIQQDIDAVPELAAWQALEDGALFDKADKFDKVLKTLPEWQDKPRADRYREVVRLVSGQPAAASVTKQQIGSAVSGAKAQAAARAAPISHSDLPAGSPAAQSESEALEGLDITQLAEKMQGLSPERIEQLLERVG